MIIESLAEELVDIQIDNPYKVLGLIGLLTVLILPGALQVQIKPSTEAILPQDDPVVESLDSLRAEFAGDTTHVVIHDRRDVRTEETMRKMLRIQNRVETSENILGSTSPASMLKDRYGEIPETQSRLRQFNYRGTISSNHRTAVISFRADTQAKSEEIRNLYNKVHRIAGSEKPGDEYYLTGYNIIDLATFQVIINDFITITAVSFTAVLLVLYGVFRDIKRMLFPIAPVMLALIWMIGLGGYLGADLTIISMVSAAMIMGLGIDFGIHVTKKYFNTDQGQEGLTDTMTELSRGLLGGSATTSVGFLALLAANLTGMHSLGIFLFTGITSAYVGAVVLLPTLIIITENIDTEK